MFEFLVLCVVVGGFIVLVLRGKKERARKGKFGYQNAKASTVANLDRQLEVLGSARVYKTRPINRSAYQLMTLIEGAVREHAPNARVLAEVGMGAFLRTHDHANGDPLPDDKEAFRSFVAKRVDFLVIDWSGNPAFAVEFQGSGHYIGGDAAGRDAVKKEALRRAGVELVEIHDHSSVEERKALIVGALRRNCPPRAPTNQDKKRSNSSTARAVS